MHIAGGSHKNGLDLAQVARLVQRQLCRLLSAPASPMSRIAAWANALKLEGGFGSLAKRGTGAPIRTMPASYYDRDRTTIRLETNGEGRPTIRLDATHRCPLHRQYRVEALRDTALYPSWTTRSVLIAEAFGLLILLLLSLSLAAIFIVMRQPPRRAGGVSAAAPRAYPSPESSERNKLSSGAVRQYESVVPNGTTLAFGDPRIATNSGSVAMPEKSRRRSIEQPQTARQPQLPDEQVKPDGKAVVGGDGFVTTKTVGRAPVDRSVKGIVVARRGAYVRSGPGTTHQIIGGLPDATLVTAVKRANDWLQIEAATGDQGWIAAELVQVEVGDIRALPVAMEGSDAR